MPLLFTMSLLGSIGTFFYIILYPFAKKHLSIQWRRYYLICNILEYILPLPYYNTLYGDLLAFIWKFHVPCITNKKAEYTNYTSRIIQITPNKIIPPNWIIFFLLTGIILIGLCFFSCQFYRYLKIKRILRNTTENLTDSTYIQIMQDEFSDKQITPSLQIFQYQELDTPFVIGVFRPIIILPLQSWTTDELQLIIEHESIHIRQRDNLIKILVLCMLALNFYNPFAWYVLYQWNLVAELSCDYKIMTGRTKEEIKKYGLLLIRMAEHHANHTLLPLTGLNMQNKIIKERIYQMKKGIKKEKLYKKIWGTCIMGATLFSSSLSVFAYSPKSVIYTEEVFDQLIVSDYEEKVYKDLPVNKNGGWVFFDEDGTILVELDELSLESEAFSTCRHTYESCKATNHIKYPDNSCKVEYYYAQKCSNCGNLKLGDLFNTATNTSCPH